VRNRVSLPVTLGLAALGSCIIPDRDILVEGEFTNRGAVRIVERLTVTPEVDMDCDELSATLTSCPLVPESLPSGLISTPFCVCPENSTDNRHLLPFNIFAEDPDRDEDGRPKDEIRGAFLLDLDPLLDYANEAVAYPNLLQPDRTAEKVIQSEYADVIGRPDPQLRVFRILGDNGVIDLCNDNNGAPLEPGLHTLHVVVTDRDWARPVARDEMGEPLVNPDTGEIVFLEEQFGVPDLANGATYDTAVYVFSCGEGEMCDCTSDEP
jgi:hypothetical protein